MIDDSVAQARAKIEGAGFEFAQRPAPTCSPQNTVTEQDPAAGSEADEGSTVTVTVSLGLTIEVPDVSGLAERDAAEQLKNEQLQPDSQPKSSRDVKAGKVISTTPPAGTEVDCQSTVTMLVSKGANLIRLPDLVGPSRRSLSRRSAGSD